MAKNPIWASTLTRPSPMVLLFSPEIPLRKPQDHHCPSTTILGQLLLPSRHDEEGGSMPKCENAAGYTTLEGYGKGKGLPRATSRRSATNSIYMRSAFMPISLTGRGFVRNSCSLHGVRMWATFQVAEQKACKVCAYPRHKIRVRLRTLEREPRH